MKQLLSACLLLAFGSAARGGPNENAIMAAMRLSEASSYSWVATVSDDARTYDIDGQTLRTGFSRVKMPVINSVRRRLGRSVADTRAELIFLGNVACVIRTDDGWLLPDELPPEEPAEELTLMPTGHSPIGVAMGGVTVVRHARAIDPRQREDRNYSNLQLAVSLPHEELAVMVGSHQDFAVQGDVVSGTLTDLGAQLLLVRDGQKEIVPLRAAGSFKLWLRDGLVTKYQVRLEGILSVDTPRGRRQIEVHQTTDTVVKAIGATNFEVPAQARAKLDRLARN